MSQMEKVITSLIERKVPFNGRVESDVWNDTIEEMVQSIGVLQTAWNTLLYPMLGSLPDGPVEVTTADRHSTPNPFDNGMDGSQIYMDMTATVSDEEYYSSINDRPYTIKETFIVFQEAIQDDIQAAREAATFAGITEAQKEAIGANIFYTNRTSSPSSLDGRATWNQTAIEQMIADIFNLGTDADSPPNLALYPVEDGLQTRDNTIMELLESLMYYHDNTLGSNWIEVHHAFADPALEGSTSPQIYSDKVKAVSLVDSDFASGSWPGTPSHLEDELNQIRTMIKRLSGASLWTGLPLDPWPGHPTGNISLQQHMNRVGSTTPTAINPHGITLADIGYVFPTAEEVTYTPTGGMAYIFGATNVKEALETLDFELSVVDGGLSAEISARIAADDDLQTQIDDISAGIGALDATDIAFDDSGLTYVLGSDVDAALTAIDVELIANQADHDIYDDHIDGTTDPAHDGSVIEFTGNQSPPLTATRVEAAINELHGLVQTAALDITAFHFDGDKIATSPAAHATSPRYAFTFYVNPVTGDDQDNSGRSVGFPYKTINRALQDVGANVMFPVRIFLAAGAYTECIKINKEISDHGYLKIIGQGAGPANTTIDPGTAITQPKGVETEADELEVLFTSGTYTGISEAVYTIQIDSEGTPDTFSYYRNEELIAEEIPIVTPTMDLERGINLEWDSDTGHIANYKWSFRAIPKFSDIIQVINTPKVHFENFKVQNARQTGIRVANGSKVVANKLHVESCPQFGVLVENNCFLVMTDYDLSLCRDGLRVQYNSFAQVADGASAGGNNTDYGIRVKGNSGVESCDSVPNGTIAATTPINGTPDTVTFAWYKDDYCWTTSTSTSTTTTTTSTTTTTT
jgi:hypothetical protein